MNKFILTAICIIFLLTSFASAMIIDSTDFDNLYPGQSANLKISVKNTLQDDVEDVSVVLDLEDTLFTTIGGTEDSEDKIKDDGKETFSFEIKAPADIKPGDYNIPYTITYTDWNDEKQTKTGSFGVSVDAKTELNYGIEVEKNIIGEKGKVSFKIVNSGLGEIKFISVKVISANGFEILSNKEEYIGNLGSDDFDIVAFDVKFQSTDAKLITMVTYKDFDNNEQTETITLPVKVYTKEKALELGLIKKSKKWIYIIIVAVIIVWWIWRRRKKRKKNSEGAAGR